MVHVEGVYFLFQVKAVGAEGPDGGIKPGEVSAWGWSPESSERAQP